MGGKTIIAYAVLMFLSLWSALYLESGMASGYFMEIFIIAVMTASSFAILFAIIEEKENKWVAALVFFSAAVLNTLYIFFASGQAGGAALSTLINAAGIGMSVFMLKKEDNIFEQLPEEREEPHYSSPYYEEIDVEPVKGFSDLEIYETAEKKKKPKKKKKRKK